MNDYNQARFITTEDEKIDNLFFSLPTTWWSRPYEYAWAMNFANEDDIVLDAACGISHPFKFWLAQNCKEAFACDWDARIENKQAILEDIVNDFGIEQLPLLNIEVFNKLHLNKANLTELPYNDNTFTKIFCISVVEHLQPTDLVKVLQEFHRTLQNDGLLVLTLDYPTVDLSLLHTAIDHVGLQLITPIDTTVPNNILQSEQWGTLNVIRLLLKK